MKKYTEPNVIIDSGNMHEERRWVVAANANAIYNANRLFYKFNIVFIR